MHKIIATIGKLPEPVRIEINRKIRDGWQYRTITSWLFAQTAEQDIPDLNLKTGEPYSLVWTRNAKYTTRAHVRCVGNLCKWFKHHYPEWLLHEAQKEESIRLVERIEDLTSAASDKAQPGSSTGGTLLIRSLLLDAINKARTGNSDPDDLARLANAWARVNEGGFRVQGSIDLALQSLRDEIKANPEALEAFNKLRGAVKKSTKRS